MGAGNNDLRVKEPEVISNCQDGDCDSVYCVLSQFPRTMDMKPKTLRQVVLTGYALYYDRKTHFVSKQNCE